MTGQTLGHYQVLSKLGAGGMGEVYRARDTKLDREVALKVLPAALAHDAERLARFEREAKVLASLNHPNIAILHGLEDSGDRRALVMELVDGPTLADRIAAGPIPLEEALVIARQIIDALEYAHDHGVIHRDLKPANVKVTPEGLVKVLDFGLAKALEGDRGTSGDTLNSPTLSLAPTQAGMILGTAAYMAPEQARGGGADRRADIWAFGVVLYEMLTGRQAFSRDTVSDTLAAVLTTDPDWNPLPASTPPVLERLLRRCLMRDRKQRLQAIGEARITLAGPLEETRAAPGLAGTVPAPARRPLAWMAAAALCLLAAAAVGVLHFRESPPAQQVVKLSLSPPEGTAFGSIAVSPEGGSVAFTATDGNGRTQLWVRSLDSLDARPLPGTEGAYSPFWSPDSRSIGFFANRTLKRIDATGGGAQTLSNVVNFAGGGAWSRDGVILFSSNINGQGLRTVPAAGGEAKLVTELDVSEGETAHRFPHFLPDGRHFIYSAATRRPESTGTYLASLDSKGKKLLARTDVRYGHAAFAPGEPGHLLFLRRQTLVAQAFDASRLTVIGEAVPLAEPVGIDGAGRRAKFSTSSGGVLVYDSSGLNAVNRLLWWDRSGKRLGSVGSADVHSSLELAPDGMRLAANRGTQNTDIWLFDLVRNMSSRFTFDAATDGDMVWSPDGSRIAFWSSRSGPGDIYVKASNGVGNDELLLRSSYTKIPTDWTSDGRFLIYAETDPKTQQDLWALPMEGERKPILILRTEFSERSGRVSADGRWIAYASDESGREEIYVQPFAPGSSGGSVGKWQVSADGGTEPRWRRDGKELFYLALDKKLMAVDVKTSGTFEAGVPKVLFQTHEAGRGSPYDVTADGQRFIIISADETVSAPATVVLHWQAALKQ